MSVVNPVRYNCEPDDALCRLSQELPSQAIGPCTRCATSVIGCSAILAPSKAHPPAAAPGVSCLVQPFLRSFADLPWFLPQAGSSNTSCSLLESELMPVPPEHDHRHRRSCLAVKAGLRLRHPLTTEWVPHAPINE